MITTSNFHERRGSGKWLADAITRWRPLALSLCAIALLAGISDASAQTSSTTWQSFSMTSQTGTFTATFNMVPNQNNIDATTGIQNGTATTWGHLACIVRFNPSGQIDARNGSSYAAATTINYTAGISYAVRLVINVPAKTYSIYVTPSGQSEVTLGSNYAFRTEQASVTSLNAWSLHAGTGSHTVSNMSWGSGTDTTPPSTPTNLSATAASSSQINLSWTASTDNVGVTGYNIYRGGTLLTTVTGTTYANTGLTANTAYSYYVRARDAAGNLSGNSNTASATTQASGGTAVSKRIAGGMDDVEQNANGSILTNSTDIELVYDTSSTGNQTIGLRFTALGIPQGATINQAYIQFTCDEAKSGTGTVTIRAEAADNSSAFTTATNNVSNRTKTAASVSWSPPAWNTVGAATTNERTPELKSIVQEVVNRSGFGTSSAMAFILTGTGTRTAEAYEGSSTQAPLLYVNYTPGSGDTTPPSTPANLTASAVSSSQINLSWTASTDNVGVTGYNIYRGGTLLTTVTGTTYSNTGLTASTTYSYHVRARDAAGNLSGNSNTASATTQSSATLPAPWVQNSIGSPAIVGNAAHGSGIFTISAAGADIWGTSDQFHFVHQPRTGDVTVTVRVDSLTNTNSWAKSGIMIREGTAANAKHVSVFVTPSNGVNLHYRTSTGGTTTNINSAGGVAPYWLRLARSGNAFTASKSSNGSTWTSVGSINLTLTAAVNVGLAVTSHNTGSTTTSAISNVTVAGADTTAPSIPTNLTATAISSSQINLSWTASTDNVGVTGYNIYRGGSLLTTVTGTTYSNTGLSAGTTYSYYVRARDAAGNLSGNSTTASATTQSAASYTLQTTINGSGTLTRTPNKSSYSAGEQVTLTATPSGSNAFLAWGGDAPNWKRPVLTITMNSNKNISVTFGTNAAVSHYNAIVNSNSVKNDPNGVPREQTWDYGEGFSWNVQYNSQLDRFVSEYVSTGQTIWLDQGVRMYDWLITRMEEYPDGYRGWIGELVFPPADNIRGSAIVGDANLIMPMLYFSEVVLDNPTLASIYGVYANEYVDLAKELVAKWNARGSFQKWDRYAAYARQIHFVSKTDGSWVTVSSARKTENQNKSSKFGLVHLRIYRITGETSYRADAERLFNQYKRRFRYVSSETRYIWNFWEPFAGTDFKADNTPNVTWMGVHAAQASYQADEVKFFVEAYDTGVTFKQEDIQRMVNTNIWMWTGSAWRSADGSSSAGMLWGSLLRFSTQLQSIAGTSMPVSWTRVYESVNEANLPNIPIYNSQHFISDTIVPMRFRPSLNETARIWVRTNGSGTLTMSLRTTGGTHLMDLNSQSAGVNTDRFYTWNGKNASGTPYAAGKYIIRIQLLTSQRDIEVEIYRSSRTRGFHTETLSPRRASLVFVSQLTRKYPGPRTCG